MFALASAVWGCLAVVIVANVLARLWRRRLDPRAIVAASAVLTFVLFWALPLYLAIQDRPMASGPMFG